MSFYPKLIYCHSIQINIDSPNTSQPSPQAKAEDVSSLILKKAQIQWVLSIAQRMILKQHDVNETYTLTCSLNLLYRGSRDGYRPRNFHSKCDNKGPTITVIRTGTDNEIIGGFNPTSWDKTLQNFKPTSYSFLFAVKSSGNVVSFCQKSASAVRNSPTHGPTFGIDLVVFDNFLLCCNSATQHSYDKPIRDSSELFSVDEIEVFQVTF